MTIPFLLEASGARLFVQQGKVSNIFGLARLAVYCVWFLKMILNNCNPKNAEEALFLALRAGNGSKRQNICQLYVTMQVTKRRLLSEG